MLFNLPSPANLKVPFTGSIRSFSNSFASAFTRHSSNINHKDPHLLYPYFGRLLNSGSQAAARLVTNGISKMPSKIRDSVPLALIRLFLEYEIRKLKAAAKQGPEPGSTNNQKSNTEDMLVVVRNSASHAEFAHPLERYILSKMRGTVFGLCGLDSLVVAIGKLVRVGLALGHFTCRLWPFFSLWASGIYQSLTATLVSLAGTLEMAARVVFSALGFGLCSNDSSNGCDEKEEGVQDNSGADMLDVDISITVELEDDYKVSTYFEDEITPCTTQDKDEQVTELEELDDTPIPRIQEKEIVTVEVVEVQDYLEKESDADTTLVEHSLSLDVLELHKMMEESKKRLEQEAIDLLDIAYLFDSADVSEVDQVEDEEPFGFYLQDCRGGFVFETMFEDVSQFQEGGSKHIDAPLRIIRENIAPLNFGNGIPTDSDAVHIGVGIEAYDDAQPLPDLLAEAMGDDWDLPRSKSFNRIVDLSSPDSIVRRSEKAFSSRLESSRQGRPLPRSQTMPPQPPGSRSSDVQGKRSISWFLP